MSCAFLLNRLRFPSRVILRQFNRRQYAKKYAQVDLKNTRYTQIYRDLHGAIVDETIAKDFVYALDKKERQLLLVELQKFEAEQKKVSEEDDHIAALTRQQKIALFFHHAVPFMVFGFMDNFIMIICGEYIEFQFGALFNVSTMAAAGMGNLVSDVIGIGSGAYVEKIFGRFGVLKAPKLTPEQADLPSTKSISNWGRTVGITIGCILGMFPLFLNWFKT